MKLEYSRTDIIIANILIFFMLILLVEIILISFSSLSVNTENIKVIFDLIIKIKEN